MLGMPLGIIIGYSMTALLIVYWEVRKYFVLLIQWKVTFVFQALAHAPLAVFTLMIPSSYLHGGELDQRDRKKVNMKKQGGVGTTVLESLNIQNLSEFSSNIQRDSAMPSSSMVSGLIDHDEHIKREGSPRFAGLQSS
jgi:hypothetical protein